MAFREFAFIFVSRNGTEIRVAFSSSEGFGTEFRVVISSAEGFGTEFQDFLFRGTAGIPSEITICSVYSVFRGIIFLSEIPNPKVAEFSEWVSQWNFRTFKMSSPALHPPRHFYFCV